MAYFIISYDQHKDRDYTPVLKKLGEWRAVRVLESLWLAHLNATAEQVRDAFRATTKYDDSLVVIELKAKSDWAGYAVQDLGAEWLRRNIKS
jgi:CRISPR/Cas system-associated endoribonuclease Cas2